MEHAAEKSTLFHGRRRFRARHRNGSRGGTWHSRGRRRRISGQTELGSGGGADKDESAENDGRTNHRQVKHEVYQSVMKSIFASLIVASFPGSVLEKIHTVFGQHGLRRKQNRSWFART